jgi:hypothetical protein
MSKNEIALVDMDNVPAYLRDPGRAREMNAEATAGISTGFPPSIRIKNGKFRLVDGAGEETVLKHTDLKEGIYLDMVVLRAKPGLNKVWYAKPYDPNAEASAPDCFSLDGSRPDPSVREPQCGTCAACPMNAWGSGRNQAGEATKGKACADNKILAVLHKGGVYQFKIPPASLKNWGVFVKNLSARDIPLGAVIVYASFDDEVDYSVLTFRVGNFIPETHIDRLIKIAGSPEVEEIINPSAPPNPPVNQPGADKVPETKAKPKPAPAPDPTADLFGDGDEGESSKEKEEKPKRTTRPAPAKKDEEDVSDVPTDAEIAASLGL